VLVDVSFGVRPGESVALVGANGAGKSTLIKILLGLARADAGEVRLFESAPSDEILREKVGYLPELPGFWGELSAVDFLDFMGRLRGIPARTRAERSAKLLDALGLKERGARPMAGYSKGMLQRTGIAQALLHDPKLLVLDEPMSGLDPRAQEKLRQILLKLRERGVSLLISSHALDDIRSLTDRTLVLEKGRLLHDGPTKEVLDVLVEKYRSSEPWDEDPMGAGTGVEW